MEKPPKLAPEDVKRRLLLIIDQGRVTYTDHCRDKSMPDGNVTTQDVEYLLETGIVSSEADWSDVHRNWKYRVQGTDIEGEELEAVFVIIESHLVAYVITVF